MSLKRFNVFALLIVMALCGMLYVEPALAQNNVPMEEDTTSLNLVPRGLFAMMVQRVPDGAEGDFNLHATNIGTVSGCINVKEPKVKVTYTQKKVDITLEEDAEFELDNEQVRYGAYSCNIQTGALSFDVRLNRDELLDRGITMIGLKSKKYGQYSNTEIDVTKDRIEFESKYPGGSGFATFWFYPSNTVILHAPSAKTGQDVGELIEAFADRNGLVSLKHTLKGFEIPVWVKNVQYYTDPRGKIFGQVASAEKDTQVGRIQLTRTMYGPNGATEQPYDLPVFARKPGLND